MNEPSRFGKFVQKAASPEAMAFGWLPLAGVLESIASRGQSPGTAALGQQKVVLGGIEDRRQREQEEEERRRKLSEEARKKVLMDQYGETVPEEDKPLASAFPEEYGKAKIGSMFSKPGSEPVYQIKMRELAEIDAMPEGPEKQQRFKNFALSSFGGGYYGLTPEGIEAETNRIRSLTPAKAGESAAKSTATERSKRNLGPSETEKSDVEMKINTMVRGDKRVGDYREIARSYQAMSSVWNDDIKRSAPENKAAIDQSLITLFNKSLDPGSVVRESEYARTPSGQAIMAQLPGFVEKLRRGGAGITDQFRDEMVRVAGELKNAARKEYGSVVSEYVDKSRMWGARPEAIFTPGDLGIMQEIMQSIQSGAAQPNQPTPPVSPRPQQTNRFNSVEEAERANLPKGTVIYIQGRKAVVE